MGGAIMRGLRGWGWGIWWGKDNGICGGLSSGV